MIWKILLILATGAGLIYAADHNTFKNCSRVEFCRKLRSRPFQDLNLNATFKTDKNEIEITTSTVTFIISYVNTDTVRVQIRESDPNKTRYQLKDVLDGNPQVQGFDSVIANNADTLTMVKGDNKVVFQAKPLLVSLYKADLVVAKIDGRRFTMNYTATDKSFSVDIAFPQAVQLYGIHEHADRLNLRSTKNSDPYRLRNLDVAYYELNSPMSLYGAIPVLYGHGTQGTAGIFLHNAAEQWVEITNENNTSAYFMVESGALDLFVLLGPTPKDVVRQYVNLTGTAHLPQLWTLGYHQCRWNYDNQSDVKNVVANFDKYKFPLDAIWLDIEYTDGKRYFTWNPQNFTDPTEMQKNISATNRKLVTIIDPHIKVDQNYEVYSGALRKNLFVKNANGSAFQGDCWPGLSSYMDFLNPEARSYYARFYSYDKFNGSSPTLAGFWNDMNEPSVFDDSLEKTLPGDAVHFGGVAHRDIHNIYGFLHTMSTHEGLLKRDNATLRPFILTRSHFAGSQRYAMIWTGDNTADWGYISASYSECLNANLLGLVFCGADVGGFFGDPDPELLMRWYQAGAWLPFYRGHANLGTKRREPYLYPDDVQAVIRQALNVRYRHLPYWYTLFYEHVRNKDPIIRPLFYEFPSDPNVTGIDSHLLVGRNIMVRPVTAPDVKSVPVYFPGGPYEYWLNLDHRDVHSGIGYYNVSVDISQTPVFYRAGTVTVLRSSVGRNSADGLDDPFVLLAFNDPREDTANGTAYIDDYKSFKYRDQKDYLYVNIVVRRKAVEFHVSPDSTRDITDFRVSDVYVYDLGIPPEQGRPGKAVETVYRTDASGTPLKDLKLDANKRSLIIQL